MLNVFNAFSLEAIIGNMFCCCGKDDPVRRSSKCQIGQVYEQCTQNKISEKESVRDLKNFFCISWADEGFAGFYTTAGQRLPFLWAAGDCKGDMTGLSAACSGIRLDQT